SEKALQRRARLVQETRLLQRLLAEPYLGQRKQSRVDRDLGQIARARLCARNVIYAAAEPWERLPEQGVAGLGAACRAARFGDGEAQIELAKAGNPEASEPRQGFFAGGERFLGASERKQDLNADRSDVPGASRE